MAPVTRGETVVEVAKTGLSLLVDVVQFVPIPYASQVVSLVASIVSMVEGVRNNKARFLQLVTDIQELVCAVVDLRVQSAELTQSVDDLVLLLTKIKEFVQEHNSRNIFQRTVTVKPDASKIQEYRTQIRHILEVFQLKAQIKIQDGVEQIHEMLKKVQGITQPSVAEGPVYPAPYPNVNGGQPELGTGGARPASPRRDSDANISNHNVLSPPTHDSTIPGDLHKYLQTNCGLRSILGVAIVFHDTPSILQISRVLGVEWADVSAALKPISSESYFDHLDLSDYNSDVKPRQNLKDSLLQRTGTVWLDPAKYHSLVAQWCLGDQTPDARDIIYAFEFWDHHVCHANPTAELYEALRRSWMPLDPVSREKLPGIIYWLEENGGTQVPDLVSTYREQSCKPPEQVQIMGGMLSMPF